MVQEVALWRRWNGKPLKPASPTQLRRRVPTEQRGVFAVGLRLQPRSSGTVRFARYRTKEGGVSAL